MKEIKKALNFLKTKDIHHILTGSLAIEKEYDGFIKERRPDGVKNLDIILNLYNFSKLLELEEIENAEVFNIHNASLNRVNLSHYPKTAEKLEELYFKFSIREINLSINVFLNSRVFKKIKKEGRNFLPTKEIIKMKRKILKAYIHNLLIKEDVNAEKKIIKHLEDIIYISLAEKKNKR